MGGNLFSTSRLDNSSYEKIKDEILTIFKSLNREVFFPDSFKNKKDHGDLDVILCFPLITVEQLKKYFGVDEKDIYQNNSVISFKYKDFQIDLCHFPKEHLTSALNYYRQSDCSNMIGVLAKYSLGYRLTHKGLMYPVYLKPEDYLGEIFVSKDQEKILEFIDLDYKQWREGFNVPQELFVWISKSKYFNKKCFSFESLNHENRTRNRKRKIYSDFVAWCESNTFENNYVPSENKQEHLFRGLLHFYSDRYWISDAEELIKKRYLKKKAKESFNGNDIQSITGYTGIKLGLLINQYEEYLRKKHVLTKTSGHGSVVYYLANKTKEFCTQEFTEWFNKIPKQ